MGLKLGAGRAHVFGLASGVPEVLLWRGCCALPTYSSADPGIPSPRGLFCSLWITSSEDSWARPRLPSVNNSPSHHPTVVPGGLAAGPARRPPAQAATQWGMQRVNLNLVHRWFRGCGLPVLLLCGRWRPSLARPSPPVASVAAVLVRGGWGGGACGRAVQGGREGAPTGAGM